MIVTYFRSSSYGQWDMCQMSYYLRYALGVPDAANIKADKGNITHKALEALARMKLATQKKQTTFTDDETGKVFAVKTFTPEEAMKFGWWFYTEYKPTKHKWTTKEWNDCRGWMYEALTHNDGQFSPLKRDIITPEQYFDFEIREPWATYSFTLPDGSKLEGYLAVKGTVDLVTRIKNGIEYIDWKTGKRIDWATGKVKDEEALRDDPQLRLYHYALTKLYPKTPHIVMSIFFLQDGGPFSLPFGPEDIEKTENMLRKRFDVIRKTQVPRLSKSWRCTAFCHYGKNKQEGTGKTICQHHADELQELGLDRAMKKYADVKAISQYGDGGGRTNKQEN